MQRMIDYLRQLPSRQFDFGSVVNIREHECGTVGCIIGHCPNVFPEVELDLSSPDVSNRTGFGDFRYWIKGTYYDSWSSFVAELFGVVGEYDADRLFMPWLAEDDDDEMPDNCCSSSSAPDQVATMLANWLSEQEVSE